MLMTADVPDPAAQRTLASRGARLGATVTDGMLGVPAQFMPPPFRFGWVALLVVINLWGVQMHGQTIGKCLWKILIADPDTNLPPGYMRAAVIRSGPQAVLVTFFPTVGLLYMIIDSLFIFSKSRRCLHDRLAQMLVIVGTREWWGI